MHSHPVTADLEYAFENQTVNVLLLYDTKDDGRRAMRLLDSLNERIGSRHQLQVQLWRVDLLEDPEWRSFVAPDLERADLFVVAANEAPPPGRDLQDWLRRLLVRKRDTGMAVAMFPVARGNTGAPPPWFRFLRAVTARSDIKFVARFTPAVTIDPWAVCHRNRRTHTEISSLGEDRRRRGPNRLSPGGTSCVSSGPGCRMGDAASSGSVGG